MIRSARPPAVTRKALSVGVTAMTVIAIAAATVGVVRSIYPNPPTTVTTPTGSFQDDPIVISLPAEQMSYLGAYGEGVPASYAGIESLASTTGVHPNIALYYSGWEEPFQTAFARQAAAHGGFPLIQIEPRSASIAAISAGAYDAYLDSYANAVASYGAATGRGVIISFGHEPNGTWYPWGYKRVSPTIWIAAWRHIVKVFRRQGADDVTWLWTVNIIDTKGAIPDPAPWWPGGRYVTWVGIDGYYYKSTWQFASLFGPTIKVVRSLTRDPILISETGASPASGKAGRISNLFAGIRAYGLLGFVWFDADRVQDWRIDTGAAAAAYRAGARTFNRLAS